MNGDTAIVFKKTRAGGGKMGMGDHGFVCLGPVVFVPEKPGILWLIKNKQGLVAYLGEFRSPSGAALDGAVRLDCADNDDLLAAADLPADGLQDFAEKGVRACIRGS